MNAPLETGSFALRRLRRGARFALPGVGRSRREGAGASAQDPPAYADRGTALHAAMALLIEHEAVSSTTSPARRSTTTPSRSTTSKTRCGRFSPMWRRCSTRPGLSIYLEHRVVFPTIADTFGTADLIVRIGSTIHVIDFKFGAGVRVLALYPDGDEDVINAQLLFYAAAARHSLPEFFAGVDNIVLTILQPHVDRARRRDGVVGRGHARRA